MRSKFFVIAQTIIMLTVCMPARAVDLLGIYVGAGAGQSTVRVADAVMSSGSPGAPISRPFSISKDETGWKLQLGIRPISLFGVEIEYLDFGSARTSGTLFFESPEFLTYNAHSRVTAQTIWGLLYVPVPLPRADLYGKLGLARLEARTSAAGSYGCYQCVVAPYQGSALRDSSSTNLAYGAGVQFRLGHLAIRGEYERIDAHAGAPDLLSLGVTWIF